MVDKPTYTTSQLHDMIGEIKRQLSVIEHQFNYSHITGQPISEEVDHYVRTQSAKLDEIAGKLQAGAVDAKQAAQQIELIGHAQSSLAGNVARLSHEYDDALHASRVMSGDPAFYGRDGSAHAEQATHIKQQIARITNEHLGSVEAQFQGIPDHPHVPTTASGPPPVGRNDISAGPSEPGHHAFKTRIDTETGGTVVEPRDAPRADGSGTSLADRRASAASRRAGILADETKFKTHEVNQALGVLERAKANPKVAGIGSAEIDHQIEKLTTARGRLAEGRVHPGDVKISPKIASADKLLQIDGALSDLQQAKKDPMAHGLTKAEIRNRISDLEMAKTNIEAGAVNPRDVKIPALGGSSSAGAAGGAASESSLADRLGAHASSLKKKVSTARSTLADRPASTGDFFGGEPAPGTVKPAASVVKDIPKTSSRAVDLSGIVNDPGVSLSGRAKSAAGKGKSALKDAASKGRTALSGLGADGSKPTIELAKGSYKPKTTSMGDTAGSGGLSPSAEITKTSSRATDLSHLTTKAKKGASAIEIGRGSYKPKLTNVGDIAGNGSLSPSAEISKTSSRATDLSHLKPAKPVSTGGIEIGASPYTEKRGIVASNPLSEGKKGLSGTGEWFPKTSSRAVDLSKSTSSQAGKLAKAGSAIKDSKVVTTLGEVGGRVGENTLVKGALDVGGKVLSHPITKAGLQIADKAAVPLMVAGFLADPGDLAGDKSITLGGKKVVVAGEAYSPEKLRQALIADNGPGWTSGSSGRTFTRNLYDAKGRVSGTQEVSANDMKLLQRGSGSPYKEPAMQKQVAAQDKLAHQLFTASTPGGIAPIHDPLRELGVTKKAPAAKTTPQKTFASSQFDNHSLYQPPAKVEPKPEPIKHSTSSLADGRFDNHPFPQPLEKTSSKPKTIQHAAQPTAPVQASIYYPPPQVEPSHPAQVKPSVPKPPAAISYGPHAAPVSIISDNASSALKHESATQKTARIDHKAPAIPSVTTHTPTTFDQGGTMIDAAATGPGWHANANWQAIDDASKAKLAGMTSAVDPSQVLETRSSGDHNLILRMADGTYKSVNTNNGVVANAGTWDSGQWGASSYAQGNPNTDAVAVGPVASTNPKVGSASQQYDVGGQMVTPGQPLADGTVPAPTPITDRSAGSSVSATTTDSPTAANSPAHTGDGGLGTLSPAWHANPNWNTDNLAGNAAVAGVNTDPAKGAYAIEQRPDRTVGTSTIFRMSDGTYQAYDPKTGVSGAGTWNASEWNDSKYAAGSNPIPSPTAATSSSAQQPDSQSVGPVAITNPKTASTAQSYDVGGNMVTPPVYSPPAQTTPVTQSVDSSDAVSRFVANHSAPAATPAKPDSEAVGPVALTNPKTASLAQTYDVGGSMVTPPAVTTQAPVPKPPIPTSYDVGGNMVTEVVKPSGPLPTAGGGLTGFSVAPDAHGMMHPGRFMAE